MINLYVLYFPKGEGSKVDSRHDAEDYHDLRLAMDMLEFTVDEQETIYKILAAVLKLGNIYFITVEVSVGLYSLS